MTPLQASNAAHAKREPVFSARETWPLKVRLILGNFRAAQRAALNWTGSGFDAIPQPCWKVTEAHSETQKKIYELLQRIGEKPNEYAARLATRARIQARKGEKPFEYTVHVSLGALAELLDLPTTTLQRNLISLGRKHSVRRMEIRHRGEHAGNRAASVFYLPTYSDVLDARRADPAIATTHGSEDPKRSLQWHNGRSNSRRFLTPEEAVERWQIERLIPARPKKAATEAVSAGASTEAPARAAREPSLTSAARASRPGAVPKFVQDGLDELCGMFCDLSGAIVANLRATVARHGKEFPDAGVVACCVWHLEKLGKEVVGSSIEVDENGREHRVHQYRYKVKTSVAAYLRHVTADDHDTEGGRNWEATMRFVDNWEQNKKKELREAYERICCNVQLLRKHPDDPDLRSFDTQLARAYPEEHAKAWSEDDRKHGGDGEGKSWKNDLMATLMKVKDVRGPP